MIIYLSMKLLSWLKHNSRNTLTGVTVNRPTRSDDGRAERKETMTIIRGRVGIELYQSIKPPTSYEVNQTRAFDRIEPYAAFMYRFSEGWLYCGSHKTVEEAARVFEEHKELCYACPDVLNWFDMSDMVIMARNGADPRNSCNRYWYVCAMVVDD